jgi:3-deoxy-manno-octulosonate cytidylyltransferase (CMP-KDO synthetase)
MCFALENYSVPSSSAFSLLAGLGEGLKMSDLEMISDDALIVIPARFASSRLPGKPLIDLAGKPMIVRTAEQCLKVARRSQVVVATDDQRIAEVCRRYEILCELTDSNHQTGSDRVAEIASRISAGVYLNVQGDEPVFNPKDILEYYVYFRQLF